MAALGELYGLGVLIGISVVYLWIYVVWDYGNVGRREWHE